MNNFYALIFTFLLSATFSFTSAQEVSFSSARLTISEKEKTPNAKATYIRLYDEEAIAFDLEDYINENIDKEIWINGRYTSNKEIVEIRFDSKNLNITEECAAVKEITLQLEKSPFLGVSTIGEQNFEGVVVESLIEGGTAQGLGLMQGDVITQIGETSISSSCDLSAAINAIDEANNTEIVYTRKGKEKKRKAYFSSRVKKKISFEIDCQKTEVPVKVVSNSTANNTVLNTSPNPTTGISQVQFVSDEIQSELTLTVTDLTGKELNRLVYNDFDGKTNEYIDLSNQPQGVYFINAIHGDQTYVNKIVVQKL